MKRMTCRALCGVLLAVVCASALAAEPYPNHPIRVIVNTGAGGLVDVHVRLVAQEMARILGQPVVVENRTGADGLIGIRAVKAAAADGYTLLASANTFAQNPALKADPGYDVGKDFVGIGMISQSPMILVSASSNPDRTVGELVARAKANPNQLSFASGGVGTSTHMAGALFLSLAGIKMLHVPYKGNPAAEPDVLSGRVDMNFDAATTKLQHVRDGRLRAYGVTTAKRSPAFPDIPTLAEQGVPNYNFSVYFGLIAPAGTPTDIVQKLAQALRGAFDAESVRDRFRRDGSEAGSMTPEQFSEFLKDDAKRMAKVVSDLGIPKE